MSRMKCRFQGGWVGKSFRRGTKRDARVLEIVKAKPSAGAVPPSLRWTKLVNAVMVVIRVGKGCTKYLITFDPMTSRTAQCRGTAARRLTDGARADSLPLPAHRPVTERRPASASFVPPCWRRRPSVTASVCGRPGPQQQWCLLRPPPIAPSLALLIPLPAGLCFTVPPDRPLTPLTHVLYP